MIKAEAHSDDLLYEVEFDATDWFRYAWPDAIKKLAACGWGGDYPADAVAEHFNDDRYPEMAHMFDYLRRYNEHYKNQLGFECYVDEADARAWLAEQRPEILQLLTKEN